MFYKLPAASALSVCLNVKAVIFNTSKLQNSGYLITISSNPALTPQIPLLYPDAMKLPMMLVNAPLTSDILKIFKRNIANY